MKFSFSVTYIFLGFLLACVNATYSSQLQNRSTPGMSINQTAGFQSATNESSPDLSGQHLSRRSAISVSFSQGKKLSSKEISARQQEAQDKVQKFLVAAGSKLHTTGWVINWENTPSPKVKPTKDKIIFSFTGPASCTSEAPSSERMTIDRRRNTGRVAYRRSRRDYQSWKRGVQAKGCSGFVQGETGELRDNQHKVIYPV
ncbi:hypothetical protein F5890DRAFT_596071 [Lentinula detonsa]|uniref:Uncharacterized protein n=1 Tax=Lentinula detonsa TaxID=2804962 RepID=A0AA38UPX1_9AGAR|nr:hypothetical protein F5890DRAFT_596071 [Lentinula detonsa]